MNNTKTGLLILALLGIATISYAQGEGVEMAPLGTYLTVDNSNCSKQITVDFNKADCATVKGEAVNDFSYSVAGNSTANIVIKSGCKYSVRTDGEQAMLNQQASTGSKVTYTYKFINDSVGCLRQK